MSLMCITYMYVCTSTDSVLHFCNIASIYVRGMSLPCGSLFGGEEGGRGRGGFFLALSRRIHHGSFLGLSGMNWTAPLRFVCNLSYLLDLIWMLL